MKKIISMSMLLIFISAASFAQRGPNNEGHKKSSLHSFGKGQITKKERSELRKDALCYNAVKHHARKDGKINAGERRRLHKMRKHNRHDVYRAAHSGHYGHNGYHRGK